MSADKPMEDEQTQPSTKGSTATNSPQAEIMKTNPSANLQQELISPVQVPEINLQFAQSYINPVQLSSFPISKIPSLSFLYPNF